MGFGGIITSGSNFAPLDDDVMRWIVEARVEMELSRPTSFAVRFEDDLCGGNPAVANREQLRSNQLIGIFVRVKDRLECLVHGPITRVRTSSMVGGTGSWVEVHGEDRRAEMGRVGVQATWTGLASDAARRLISAYNLTADVETTRKQYSDQQHGLSQRHTDLAFLEDIARRNNLEFWLDYEAAEVGGAITLQTTAKLKSSPDRGTDTFVAQPPILPANSALAIDVQPPLGTCVKVYRFDARIDFERPNAARGFAQSDVNGDTVENETRAEGGPLDPSTQSIVAVDGVMREALAPPHGDPDEQLLAQQAQLTEAAWFVEVDCSSTLELLEFVVRPHQIIDVRSAGERLSGPYQVKSAIHVLNAAEHYVDFKLRANGLRAAPGGDG